MNNNKSFLEDNFFIFALFHIFIKVYIHISYACIDTCSRRDNNQDSYVDYFFDFYTWHILYKILDNINFEKDEIFFASQFEGIVYPEDTGRCGRSVGSWWYPFTVRNLRWMLGFCDLYLFPFLLSLEPQAVEWFWLDHRGCLRTGDSKEFLNPARQHAERPGSAFTFNAWMLCSIEKPLSVPSGSLPGLGCVW